MTGRPELLIGDFARRSRLPVSTLRYYDRIGLLVPAAVDATSGYRRYTGDQLPAAVLISRLRALGIPPDSIARVLAGGSSASTTLARERQRIASEIELGRERLRALDELLEDGARNDYQVEIVELEAREVAALRFLLPVAELEKGVVRAIAALRLALRRVGRQQAGSWGATFPVDLTDEISGFVFVPVAGEWHRDVDTEWLPASRAVATVHRGSPAGLPLAYLAAFAALDGLGVAATAPMIEVYETLDDPCPSTGSIHVYVPFHGVDDRDQQPRR